MTELILQTYLLRLLYIKAITKVNDFKISFMHKGKYMYVFHFIIQ